MSQEDVDEQLARAEAHGNNGGGVDVETIDGYPTASNFTPGDRLIVSKGVEPATLTGTCSGVSSNPNVTIIGDASVSVDAGLGPEDFAAAIVAGLNNPTSLALMGGADSIEDNGDGTFNVDYPPGVAPNSVVASGTDDNPTFAITYPGSSEIRQVDQAKVVEAVNDYVVDNLDIFGDLDPTATFETADKLIVIKPSDVNRVIRATITDPLTGGNHFTIGGLVGEPIPLGQVGMIVSGGGTPGGNGGYEQHGVDSNFDLPKYNKVGTAVSNSLNALIVDFFGRWCLKDSAGATLYRSQNNDADSYFTPEEVPPGNWTVVSGVGPVPTFTSGYLGPRAADVYDALNTNKASIPADTVTNNGDNTIDIALTVSDDAPSITWSSEDENLVFAELNPQGPPIAKSITYDDFIASIS